MKEHTRREVYSWIKSFAFAFILAFLCRHFLFSPTTVFGESMEPTFQDKDRVLISKISDVQRFDMIVFQAPDADEKYIKRVIGLPGDSVVMKNDILYINGKAVDEPYLKENKEEAFGNLTGDFSLKELTGETRVPKRLLFVMGDNRLRSKDSRIFGFISDDSIIGEVKFQFFPLQGIGLPK
ncbi:signal peptidase I [Bacillus sp. FSL K6-3431]|uniref:signal peptidase I n=1 Tax=Bacillus sp. FSL K6-3431 TaxID=2921500 RepID=UPI0030FCC74F